MNLLIQLRTINVPSVTGCSQFVGHGRGTRKNVIKMKKINFTVPLVLQSTQGELLIKCNFLTYVFYTRKSLLENHVKKKHNFSLRSFEQQISGLRSDKSSVSQEVIASDCSKSEGPVIQGIRDPPKVYFAATSEAEKSVILYASGNKVESFKFGGGNKNLNFSEPFLMDFEILGLVSHQSGKVIIFGENNCVLRKYL